MERVLDAPTDDLLSSFKLSKYGFLPDKCNQEIINKFDIGFQIIVENLRIKDGERFRDLVMENPFTLPEKSIFTDYDWECLYSVLTMIVNKYVWGCGENKVISVIPQPLAVLWLKVCDVVELPPVLTHAAVDLYNWELTSEDFSLETLKCINLFTGSGDEKWFYKVMIAIEGVGGKSIKNMIEIYKMLKSNNLEMSSNTMENITHNLIEIENYLSECCVLMNRMFEVEDGERKCKPEVFFNIIRIYLSGFNNTKFFENGLTYFDGKTEITISKFVGGSAAQSSLFQLFDIFFGIKHTDDSYKFLNEMHKHMPKSHSNFLNTVDKINDEYDFREYVVSMKNERLNVIYNSCIHHILDMREKHFEIARDYITKFLPKRVDTESAHQDKGTGGTDFRKMLKDINNATTKALIPISEKKEVVTIQKGGLNFDFVNYFSVIFFTLWCVLILFGIYTIIY